MFDVNDPEFDQAQSGALIKLDWLDPTTADCDWLRESRTGSAKLLTPSALSEIAFVQRTASTKQRKAARTIGVCSNSWSCLWERREKRRARTV